MVKRMVWTLLVFALVAGCAASPTPLPPAATAAPTDPPTSTPLPPHTVVPSTSTPEPTHTPLPPTATPEPPTATPEPPTPEPTNIPEIKVEVVPGEGFMLEDVGFDTPESVLSDPQADLYLVSNIGGSPASKDGDGFISRVSPDGVLLDLKWIDGVVDGVTLNAPKGMALSGDVLYVTDIDVVRMFDRESGAPKGEIVLQGSSFLNDIAAAEDGTLYVTDSSSGSVYRVGLDGAVTIIAQTQGPNGIAVNGDTVWILAMEAVYTVGESGPPERVYDLPFGGLDGLVVLDDGQMLVSSWFGQGIYLIATDGTVSELFTGLEAPADIGYDPLRQVVLVPQFNDNRVQALSLP